MTFNVSRSRSSTSSSNGFPELSPSLLSPNDPAGLPKLHAGRRLSKMRHKLSCNLLKPSHSSYSIHSASHSQTLPLSRPKLRRAISRSMIAPLQQLFGGEYQPHSDSDPDRTDGQSWSPPLTKHNSTLLSLLPYTHRHGGPFHHRSSTTTSGDADEWDFRCQGIAPEVPARPEDEGLSPMSAYDLYDHSLLGSPSYLADGSYGPSSASASSCCSSPELRFGSIGLVPSCSSEDGGCPKKQKVSIDSISAPIGIWSRSTSPFLSNTPTSNIMIGNNPCSRPSFQSGRRNQFGLEIQV